MISTQGTIQKDDVQLYQAALVKLRAEKAKRQSATVDTKQVKPAVVMSEHLAFANAYPLRKFTYDCFNILEPGREFKNNWHIDAITELLQAATLRQVRKFIINIPRRCMKSSLACISWFCWSWTFMPHTRWLYTSYNAGFAERDNIKCNQLIKSEWYQANWGHVFQVGKENGLIDRNDHFKNSKGGMRQVFKIGKGTGEGADFVIGDDPNAIDEAESDLVSKKISEGWSEVSYHNYLDPTTVVRGIIQQRCGENDLTGHLLNGDNTYEHLCLPMRFEDDHPHRNSVSKPLNLGQVTEAEKAQNPKLKVGEPKLFIDPRDKDAPKFDNKWYRQFYKKYYDGESAGNGELLWKNRLTEEVVTEMVSELKVYGESAQFQQRPIRRGGNFFRSDNFHVLSQKETAEFDYDDKDYCRFWDKAGSPDEGDYSVGMLVCRNRKPPFRYYIVDIIRVQVGYHERMALMLKTAKEDTENYITSKKNTSLVIGIEREGMSSGKDLATLEHDYLIGYNVFTERPRGNKKHRSLLVKNHSEGGKIWLLKAHWNNGFLFRTERFNPDKLNNVDDEHDCLSGALRKLIFGQMDDDYGSESGG
jgi:phage terminase large subunit-like protein